MLSWPIAVLPCTMLIACRSPALSLNSTEAFSLRGSSWHSRRHARHADILARMLRGKCFRGISALWKRSVSRPADEWLSKLWVCRMKTTAECDTTCVPFCAVKRIRTHYADAVYNKLFIKLLTPENLIFICINDIDSYWVWNIIYKNQNEISVTEFFCRKRFKRDNVRIWQTLKNVTDFVEFAICHSIHPLISIWFHQFGANYLTVRF